jgi:hypothetical protein
MLLSTAHRLDGGLRVRLRFPYTDDHRRVADLYARLDLPLDEMGARRLLRFDARRRRVVCALAWIEGADVLVGLAASEPGGERDADLLVADEAAAPGVGDLLRRALAEQASRHVA